MEKRSPAQPTPKRSCPIYVEASIAAPVETIWQHTQEPQVHQRWDVRFTEIDYLPVEEDAPQRFTYVTTVAPGLRVGGCGETLGERHRPDGTAYSGLTFWSNNPLSLIQEGSGYWRYVPQADGSVRFLTRYDYRVRWGAFGRAVDQYLFRPLFGWGTAWSFDRLRLWIEKGIAPERSRDQTIAHGLAVVTLAFIWIYQGLFPKILFPEAGELQVLADTGFPVVHPRVFLAVLGAAEVLMGLAVVRRWRSRWPFVLTAVSMPVLLAGATLGDPLGFVRPFNPLTFNLAVGVLALVVLLTRGDLPSGRTALREPPTDRRLGSIANQPLNNQPAGAIQ